MCIFVLRHRCIRCLVIRAQQEHEVKEHNKSFQCQGLRELCGVKVMIDKDSWHSMKKGTDWHRSSEDQKI